MVDALCDQKLFEEAVKQGKIAIGQAVDLDAKQHYDSHAMMPLKGV